MNGAYVAGDRVFLRFTQCRDWWAETNLVTRFSFGTLHIGRPYPPTMFMNNETQVLARVPFWERPDSAEAKVEP